MGTRKKQTEKSDTMIELEEVLDEVKAAIMTAIAEENRDSGNGDKPRCVGLRLRKNPTIEPYVPLLTSKDLPFMFLIEITYLWDDVNKFESLDYCLEIYKEFVYGLTFLDEAISY